jgi:uncharacterized protein (TIGR02145 family)
MTKIILWLCFLSLSCSGKKSEYDEVKIGNQYWMTKNLEVTVFKNGDLIQEAKSDQAWKDTDEKHQPAWCYYNNDPNLGKTYGKLYNLWAVIDPRGLAPIGWHIASDEEWETLAANCGGKEAAGGQLKESGTEHWKSPNEGATNQCKFTALPGGSRYANSFVLEPFAGLGEEAIFWTYTHDNTKNIDAKVKHLTYFNDRIREYGLSGGGLSVRCIKD